MSRDIIEGLIPCAHTQAHDTTLVVELRDRLTGEAYTFKYNIDTVRSPALTMAHAKKELAKQWSGN